MNPDATCTKGTTLNHMLSENPIIRPLFAQGAAHSGWGFAPNAGSLASNKRHLYSGPSCSSLLKAPMKRKQTPKKGGRRWRHAKKRGAVGAMPPTHYLSKPGGGRGGWGRSHTRTGPGRKWLKDMRPTALPTRSDEMGHHSCIATTTGRTPTDHAPICTCSSTSPTVQCINPLKKRHITIVSCTK